MMARGGKPLWLTYNNVVLYIVVCGDAVIIITLNVL